MQEIMKYTLLFFFYSFSGWCLESTYCSIGEKKLINRGFLTGPLCPIYGSAAIVMALLIYPLRETPLLVFLLGIVVCDIVEYVTSYMMEKLFNARWWDYTYEFCNLNGRISLKHSLHWGVVSVVFVLMVHPSVENLYMKIPVSYLPFILAIILLIFALDLANAVRKAMDFRKLRNKIGKMTDVLTENLTAVKSIVGDKYTIIQTEMYKQKDRIDEFSHQLNDAKEQFETIIDFKSKKNKISSLPARLLSNYPNLEKAVNKQIVKLQDVINDLKANIYEGEEKH
ncbi:MAG: hypothetical protein IKJ27_01940 [Clostridia bacterium]|nr:hypothetical protein [Clostridia bacterium]